MIKRLGDYYRAALDGDIVLTKFLDLEEIKEIQQLNKEGLKVYFYGGYASAERVRAIIQNELYPVPLPIDYRISIYQGHFDQQYSQIGHRHVLGSMMSLGIERNTFGDIYIQDDSIYLFITEEIEGYLIKQIPLIQHQRLSFEKILQLEKTSIEDTLYEEILVSSMRLDAIIARSARVSRNKASEWIASGMVAIDHKECTNPSKICKCNEMISIRKFGRITIMENMRTTKKDRLVLKVGIKH
ncbi:MAG: YlmH/Sll1252 family protein [Prevotella sp.]|nr:YlmH/Sll1252 family protein [Staphylococcus sp.]MCM1349946.1 YlmH/Sll1252 family protein [Prevotella sp.]